ncbi:MAG: hypothetical protein RPR98_10380 [Bermanella sp.]
MSDFWSELLNRQAATPLAAEQTGLYPISDRQVLSISGPDSAKFMQGQFTCHLDEVTPKQYRPGACCTAKGRMINNFNLLQTAEHHYLMSLHDSLAQGTQAHLKKYMVFFKSEMRASPMVLTAIKGPDAQHILQDVLGQCPDVAFAQANVAAGYVIKLPFAAGFELYLHPEQAEEVVQALLSKCSLTIPSAWPLNLIEHGLAQLSRENSEKFIPQMLNLGQTGAVSFSKGCYTGQEIVARMEYLGKLKRHLYRATISHCDALTAGDAIFTPGHDRSVGELVNWVQHGTTIEALMVLEDKYRQNSLFVNSASGPHVELLSLPYQITEHSA